MIENIKYELCGSFKNLEKKAHISGYSISTLNGIHFIFEINIIPGRKNYFSVLYHDDFFSFFSFWTVC